MLIWRRREIRAVYTDKKGFAYEILFLIYGRHTINILGKKVKKCSVHLVTQSFLRKLKVCPKCGTAVGKPKGNIKLMAIIGLIIMLIASLLPLVQSGEKIKEGVYPTAYAFSYMNISMPVLWYLFIACIVVGIILIVARKEFFSIITDSNSSCSYSCFCICSSVYTC